MNYPLNEDPLNGWREYQPPSRETLRLENAALRKRMAMALEAIAEILGVPPESPA
jgi:hypothetical protein